MRACECYVFASVRVCVGLRVGGFIEMIHLPTSVHKRHGLLK